MLDPCRSWHPCRVLRTGRVTPHPGAWVGGRGTNLQDMYSWDLPLHHLFFSWKWKDSNVLFVYRAVLFALPQLKSRPSSLHFGLRHRLGCKTELMVFAWRFVLSRSCCGGFQGLHGGIWFHWYRLWVMFKRIDCWNATNAKIQYACNHVNNIYYIYPLHTHTHTTFHSQSLSFICHVNVSHIDMNAIYCQSGDYIMAPLVLYQQNVHCMVPIPLISQCCCFRGFNHKPSRTRGLE